MSEPSTIHSTFVIERNYPKPVERVFAAFADPDLKRRWFAENEHHNVEEFEMDFRVGGGERASYRFGPGTPFPGVELSSDGIFHDIVPNRRIILASTMALAGRRFSVSLITFEFLAAKQGTGLILTHQGTFMEGADGPEMREDGWRKLLDRLAASLAGEP